MHSGDRVRALLPCITGGLTRSWRRAAVQSKGSKLRGCTQYAELGGLPPRSVSLSMTGANSSLGAGGTPMQGRRTEQTLAERCFICTSSSRTYRQDEVIAEHAEHGDLGAWLCKSPAVRGVGVASDLASDAIGSLNQESARLSCTRNPRCIPLPRSPHRQRRSGDGTAHPRACSARCHGIGPARRAGCAAAARP